MIRTAQGYCKGLIEPDYIESDYLGDYVREDYHVEACDCAVGRLGYLHSEVPLPLDGVCGYALTSGPARINAWRSCGECSDGSQTMWSEQ